jgi:hypothetical protein
MRCCMAPKVYLQRRSSGLRTSICSCRMRKRRCPTTAADHIDSCRPTHCEHTFSETRPSGASSINDFAPYILNVRLCKACQSCSVMVWSLNPAGPIPITLAHDFDNDVLKELSWWCPNQARQGTLKWDCKHSEEFPSCSPANAFCQLTPDRGVFDWASSEGPRLPLH